MRRFNTLVVDRLGLLGIGLLCLQACAVAGVHVDGRVMNVETGEPIEGAYVYAHSGHTQVCILDDAGCGFEVTDERLTRTNEDGYYNFKGRFYFGKSLGSKAGNILVYKPGFVTAPKMVAINWHSDIGETPSEYVAHYIPEQYFYGSGNYADDYKKVPLNHNHKVYYLSNRSVAELRRTRFLLPAGFTPEEGAKVEPRLIYLSGVLNQLSDRSTRVVRPLRMAIYREALSLSQSNLDKRVLHRICLFAYGQTPTVDGGETCPP